MIEPSPEEIESRTQDLDQAVPVGPLEWFDNASERALLHLFLIRHLLFSEQYELALRLLSEVPVMSQKIAANIIFVLPHERVIELVREKLELVMQHPMAYIDERGGLAGFRFDHPEVPDHLPEQFS